MWVDIKPFGEAALLIEWPQVIDKSIFSEISTLCSTIGSQKIRGVVDIVPAYASLTIFFAPELITYDKLVQIINFSTIESENTFTESGQVWEIPVSYCHEIEHDMAFLMEYSGLSHREIIEIHTLPTYDVYFIGFLPGFLYLGGLDERLYIPRKKAPDLKISAGSVAVGGVQTGIYPQDSPGGWYVIGYTDFKAIDLYSPPFCKVKAGDQVKFIQI
ncbi:MAG: 5-oxoprolinase subunit PxpB [Saprospiraceae bacterium]|nr:5-oxoprolinase subunit PxpB [Saprospiraceae bacterium]